MTRYNQPERGSTDWDVPLNENFEDLGVDVEYRDAESQLSEYTPADGAKFLSTTTDSDGYHPVYLGDGNSWNQIGTIGDLASLSTGGDPADIDALSVYDVYVYELGANDYEAVDSSGTTIDSGSNGMSVFQSGISACPVGGRINNVRHTGSTTVYSDSGTDNTDFGNYESSGSGWSEVT